LGCERRECWNGIALIEASAVIFFPLLQTLRKKWAVRKKAVKIGLNWKRRLLEVKL